MADLQSSNPNFLGPTRLFAGIPVTITNLDSAAFDISNYAKTNIDPTHVHLACASSIYAIEHDKELWKIFANGGVVLPDGKPFELLTKCTKLQLSQVRGPSLFPKVMDVGRKQALKHFFVGTTEETLGKLVSNFERSFPGVEIVGTYSPPFRSMTQEEQLVLDTKIRESKANIVWLGMSTPKQDYEAVRISNSVNKLVIAVGAAFDFSAGTQKESPRWLQALGLEWLFRLSTEPRRLWKRYLLGNASFLKAVVRKQPRKSFRD